MVLNQHTKSNYTDLLVSNNIIDDPSFSDDMIRSFQKLHSTNYEDILEWIYQLDNFISKKFNLVSKKDWIVLFRSWNCFQRNLWSPFFTILHFKSSKLITPGYLQLHEFEISNLFVLGFLHYLWMIMVNHTCKVILQILNYIRWKNGSLDLFDSEEYESPHAICPHIRSFIETAIVHAIISPEFRNYELSWIKSLKTFGPY
ncbi:CPS_collapsed_G0017060.mRNA.1.CDS.1 [Saccharomyces cerevisiae]|nr:CPS_collapsed_G0017060.mRNA.1.CDS.1 [Saccharomyces cerevisiae]